MRPEDPSPPGRYDQTRVAQAARTATSLPNGGAKNGNTSNDNGDSGSVVEAVPPNGGATGRRCGPAPRDGAAVRTVSGANGRQRAAASTAGSADGQPERAAWREPEPEPG
jgi:hypothetical protein